MGTKIAGIFSSSNLDTHCESLDINGLDISSMEKDGVANFDHKRDFPSQIVGKIIKAKKIFGPEDCDTTLESKYWEKCQLPFVFGIVELFDSEGHHEAQNLVAMLKYDQKSDRNPKAMNLVNFSIDGSVIDKSPSSNQSGVTIVNAAIGRDVAISIRQANKMATCEEYTEEPKKASPLDVIKTLFKNESNQGNILSPLEEKILHLESLLKTDDLTEHARNMITEGLKKIKNPSGQEAINGTPRANLQNQGKPMKNEGMPRVPKSVPVPGRKEAFPNPYGPTSKKNIGQPKVISGDEFKAKIQAFKEQAKKQNEAVKQGYDDPRPKAPVQKIPSMGQQPKLSIVQGGKTEAPKEAPKQSFVRTVLAETKKSEEIENFEALEKAADDDLVAKLPEAHSHMKDGLLNWSRERIPNPTARAWYLGHVVKNPHLHSVHKEEMGHHGDMMKLNKDLNKIPFNKSLSLEDGFKTMKESNDSYEKKSIEKTKGLVAPNKKTTKQIDLGNGWGWHNLNTNKDSQEAEAMGHCGTANQQAKLWSLRKEVKVGNKTLHEPHVTVEMLPGGIINQIKGKNNEKPDKKYHGPIMDLLKSPHVNHIISQGYKPETNFHVGDLKPEQKNEILSQKPDIHPFDLTDVSQIEKTIQKLPREYQGELKKWRDVVSEHGNMDNAIANGKLGTLVDLTRHPGISPKQLDDISRYNYPLSNTSIAKNPNTPKETLIRMAKDNSEDKDHDDALSFIARNPNIKDEELSPFLEHSFEKVRTGAAKNPNLKPEHISKLLDDQEWPTREAAARHENNTEETVSKAMNDEDPYVRETAVKNPKVTPKHLFSALSDPHEAVAKSALKNPNITKEHLLHALNNQNEYIAAGAAEHEKADEDILSKAIEHPSSVVRMAAAYNPSASHDVLRKAIRDERLNVRNGAATHQNAPEDVLLEALKGNDDAAISAIYNKNATPSVIGEGLKHEDGRVSAGAARHENASHDNITEALRHTSSSVPLHALSNPNLSEDHIRQALDHHDFRVRSSALRHEKLTSSMIDHVFLNEKEPELRKIAAKNLRISDKSLETALTDESESVRKAALETKGLKEMIREFPPQEIEKAESAGGLASPGSRTGLQALQKEADSLYNGWDQKGKFEEFLSQKMPNLSKAKIKALSKVFCYNKHKKKEEVLNSI